MLRDESSFIHPLMALHMCLPVIFPSFTLITGKLQEKLANKNSSLRYSCTQCLDKRVSFVQCCMGRCTRCCPVMRVSTFEGEVCIIGLMVGTLKSVRIIEVSTRWGFTVQAN